MNNGDTKSTNKYALENALCITSFAVIFEDSLHIKEDNSTKIVRITDIKNVVLKKTKKIRWSLFFIYVLILFFSFFLYAQNQVITKYEIAAVIFINLINSIIFFSWKKINYQIIFVLNETEIKLNIIKDDVYEAKKSKIIIKNPLGVII